MFQRSKLILLVLVIVSLAVIPSVSRANESFNSLRELTYYDSTQAYNGYTMFTPMNAGSTNYVYLIDMYGYLIKKWNIGSYGPCLHAYLLETGNVIVAQATADSASTTSAALNGVAGQGGAINEYTWAGKLSVSVPTLQTNPIVKQHHDFKKIWNNKLGAYTYLALVAPVRTAQEGYDKGADPSMASAPSGWSDDGIVEFSKAGKILWQWYFLDHTCNTYDGATSNYVTSIADHPEKLNVNWKGIAPDWTHCNSIDYHQDLDLIVINAKATSEFYVIDHGNTFVSTSTPSKNIAAAAGTAGDFLYRFGNPQVYGQGTAPSITLTGYGNTGHQQMWGAHNIQWIHDTAWTDGPELPGAGNFLIFDNGWYCPISTKSSILEINPYISSVSGTTTTYSDSFVNPATVGYTTGRGMFGGTYYYSKQLAWTFRPNSVSSFASPHISSAERMPNGNTVICSGSTGHFFEVTSSSEVVWEYSNPVAQGTPYTFARDNGDASSFAVFRCHRYGTGFPAFKGKNLSGKSLLNPKSTLTGRTPVADFYQAVNDGELPDQSSSSSSGETGGGGGSGGGSGGGGGSGY